MKQTRSNLIETFLFNVKKGNIISKTKNEAGLCVESGGQVFLDKITEALQAILDGEEPDTALQIERTRGKPPDPFNLELALLMHEHLKDGPNWTIAENVASNYQLSHGRAKDELLTQERLKQIYKHYIKKIQNYENLLKLYRTLEENNVPEKK